MPFLDLADGAELLREFMEPFFVGLARHSGVHVGPFGILAARGMGEVFLNVADPAERDRRLRRLEENLLERQKQTRAQARRYARDALAAFLTGRLYPLLSREGRMA